MINMKNDECYYSVSVVTNKVVHIADLPRWVNPAQVTVCGESHTTVEADHCAVCCAIKALLSIFTALETDRHHI